MKLKSNTHVRCTRVNQHDPNKWSMFRSNDWVEGYLPMVPKVGEALVFNRPIVTSLGERWDWFHTSEIKEMKNRGGCIEIVTRNSVWRITPSKLFKLNAKNKF